jgi:uncharacterized repeat protein (TIGR03803 family)
MHVTRLNPSRSKLATILALAALAFTLLPHAQAQTETVLDSLLGTNDGNYPYSGVSFDSAGNFFGTTLYGGIYNCNSQIGCGAAFEVSPPASGSGPWTETILHTFTGDTDGGEPYAGLIPDNAGNVYGATYFGGNTTSARCKPNGCGVIYELSPTGDGGWTEIILHTFQDGHDGAYPMGNLIFDSAGNLYGTTAGGGDINSTNCTPVGCGVVFELSPSASGWTETTLYAFTGFKDGGLPYTGVTFDAAGNLYGTTSLFGDLATCQCGSIFRLSPVSGGGWTETTLHVFDGIDGNEPLGPVTFDSAGNLYGTTVFGGPPEGCDDGCGLVFELTPTASGPWTETAVHIFNQNGPFSPSGPLVFDSAGNLYGTVQASVSADGGIYRMSLVSGTWKETGFFGFNGKDGNTPIGGLISDSSGNFYGTTSLGGAKNKGTVFKFVP